MAAFGLAIGDTITINVLGREVTARIAARYGRAVTDAAGRKVRSAYPSAMPATATHQISSRKGWSGPTSRKGRNGPVIVPLTKNGDTYSVPAGRKLTAAQLQAFKAGNTYVNVHTARHKGGEVRGQLTP